jgi:hypothetical protein
LPDAACQALSIQADNQVQPADIIIAIDNSGSMDEEAIWVQQNMNGFSQQIVAAKIDVRVVLISSYPGDENGICIDPPLGAGGCPTQDSKPPSFLHLNQEVSSHDALEQFVATYPQYRSVLRPNATKHFVVVTDDESDVPAATFTRDILARDPAGFANFKFHGIFSYTEGNNDHCDGLSAGEGKIYKQLVMQTGGVSGDLCLQNFKPVFDQLGKAVIGGSKLACEWTIPPPPPGKTFVPNQTNVSYGGVARSRTSTRRARAPTCPTGGRGSTTTTCGRRRSPFARRRARPSRATPPLGSTSRSDVRRSSSRNERAAMFERRGHTSFRSLERALFRAPRWIGAHGGTKESRGCFAARRVDTGSLSSC